jgi:predicted nucleotidyltransferase
MLEDVFSKRSAWRVLAALLEPPFVPHQQRELARSLRLPEASVQRGLRALVGADLVQRKRSQYVVSVGQDAVRYLWLLLQVERYSALPADLINGLSILRARDFAPEDCVIVFGSWARGIAVPDESDVDVAVFTDRPVSGVSKRTFEGPYRFEVQASETKELHQPANSVVLDALLNGIPITHRERVYDVLLDLRSFPKSFLVYRLRQADKLLLQAELAEHGSEAAVFFSGAADRIIGQVRNILEHGRTLSWRETAHEASPGEAIKDLEERLAREGEQIWLT